MSDQRKNRFGIASVDDIPVGRVPRRRGSGPMSSAVRETAESVAEATEARVEQRKQNASDARRYREAIEEGRMLWRLPIAHVETSDLPRDRLDLDGVARSDEMDELKASIRKHGQKEPIEVYKDDDGCFQLKKGWRRLTALAALFEETGDERFSLVLARIDAGVNDRLRHYIEMVEENTIRQDLTYAEMADLAIKAAADPGVDGDDAEAMVNRLYGALHKMKRSHLRSFVSVLVTLGGALPFPKALSRDLGLDVARALKEQPGLADLMPISLASCTDAEMQNTALRTLIGSGGLVSGQPAPTTSQHRDRQKYEFHVGDAKITARKGEFRIKDRVDFAEIPRERLEAAVSAFQKVLRDN